MVHPTIQFHHPSAARLFPMIDPLAPPCLARPAMQLLKAFPWFTCSIDTTEDARFAPTSFMLSRFGFSGAVGKPCRS
jgi:hypothetical protein